RSNLDSGRRWLDGSASPYPRNSRKDRSGLMLRSFRELRLRRASVATGSLGVPSMKSDQEVRVLWGTRSQEPRANRKVTAREGGAESSGERNRASTNRNRIRGAVNQGERPNAREALATKG